MSGLNYCPRLTWTYVSYVFDQLPGVVAQVPKFKSWRSKEGTSFKDPVSRYNFNKLAPVIQKVDNAIHWINRYPVENAVGFPNTCPLDSDFSGGQCYPTLKQPGPDLHIFPGRISWENLIKDQNLFPLAINLLILMSFSFDYLLT